MLLHVAKDLYAEHLDRAGALALHTRRAYVSDVGVLARHAGPGTTVAAVDGALMSSFVGRQRDTGASDLSTRRRVAAVRHFLRWARGAGVAVDGDAAVFRVTALRVRRLPRALPRGDLRRILIHLEGRARAEDSPGPGAAAGTHGTTLVAVSLMVGTGLRVGEVAQATCGDVDLESGSVRVRGKGSRERTVFLSDGWLARVTADYLSARMGLQRPHEHLLLNRAGDPLSAAAIRERVTLAAKGAGLTRHVTPHMFRHSAATQLIESGVDMRFVQRLLGHASVSTTEIYTHVADPALREAVRRADVLGGLLDRR